MKKLLALVLALMMLLSAATALAEIPDYINLDSTYPAVKDGEEITISILTRRHSTATNEVEDIWFFKWLEEAMGVTLELEQTEEVDQRINLMFASDTVPDLVWGIQLDNSGTMTYGVEEGMLLAWNDYITPELMPNTYKAMQDYPDAFTFATAPDGNIYSLPAIGTPVYHNSSGGFSASLRMYVNQDWLDACELEMPTTLDELLNVLRVFKEKDPANVGNQLIPMIGNQNKDNEHVWNALGFLGGADKWGTNFTVKDYQLALPCYTEEARAYIEFYHTLYTEGLISPDYFTLDQTSNRGLMAAGVCGVLGDSALVALTDNWGPWVAMPPLTSEYNDTAVTHMGALYGTPALYASADTEYPEVLARIVDYLYTDEAMVLYTYGPMKDGEYPMYGLDGWYYDENGKLTTAKVESGEYTDITEYAYQYIFSYSSVAGKKDQLYATMHAMAGLEYTPETVTVVDQLTGKNRVCLVDRLYTDDNNDGHWRITQAAAMLDHLTEIRLPNVYMTAEQTQRATDLKTVIDEHVKAETAKFIVGTRSLDEFDAYQEELKAMGIEEYIQIYQDVHASYIESIQVYNK